jgi:glycogen debranching enzyme
LVNVDGSLAEPPVALVEVQGYAYLAKERIAEVFEALGQPDRADQLRKEAAELKLAFNEAFWMEDEGTYALALDGNKRQVRSVTSNPGHCLSCSIADPDRPVGLQSA